MKSLMEPLVRDHEEDSLLTFLNQLIDEFNCLDDDSIAKGLLWDKMQPIKDLLGIKHAIRKIGTSEIARACNVSTRTVQRWGHGEFSPKSKHLERLKQLASSGIK